MQNYFPKDIEMIIWEYKHSAEIYEVAQEFKRWFMFPNDLIRFADLMLLNLYAYPAVNYRMPKKSSNCIFNMFQSNCDNPIAYLCAKMSDEFCGYKPNVCLSYENNWRRDYITKFNL